MVDTIQLTRPPLKPKHKSAPSRNMISTLISGHFKNIYRIHFKLACNQIFQVQDNENNMQRFLKILTSILKILECNLPVCDPNKCNQLHFPKNLSKYSLLSFQLKDYRFIQTFLTQLLILFDSFAKPVNSNQKKAFNISEADNLQIKESATKIKALLCSMHSNSIPNKISQILKRESIWCMWKEKKSCEKFEKVTDNEESAKFQAAKEAAKRPYSNIWANELTSKNITNKTTKEMSVYGNMFTDKSEFTSLFDKNKLIRNTSFVPIIAEKMLEPVYEIIDPSQKIEEEFKITKKHSQVWKILRKVLSSDLKVFVKNLGVDLEKMAKDLIKMYGNTDIKTKLTEQKEDEKLSGKRKNADSDTTAKQSTT